MNFMKISFIFLAAMLIMSSVLMAGCTEEQAGTGSSEMEQVAKEAAASIDAGLEDLRTGIENNAKALPDTDLTGEEAEKILSDNLLNYPWAISSLVISNKGIVLTAVPENYAEVVGNDLSRQSIVQKANNEKVPVVSVVFRMAEGFDGISQSYPVFSPSGDYLGYTDITYTPDALISRQILPVIEGTEYDIWVTQTNGRVIYDTTKEEIGKNLFSDPSYADPALQEIFTRIVQEPAGSGEYTFWDKDWNKNITKKAVWGGVRFDGADWRIVVTDSDQNGEKITETPAPVTETTDIRYENLTLFVENAAAYAKENGKEAALKEFNDKNGEFINGELYVFAYEMDGTVIALPYQQGLLGTVRTGIPDSNGVEFIDGLVDVAGDGGGSLYYIYPNPEDDYKEEFKLSYVMPVDSEWFVGAGIYLPELPARFNETEKDELVKRVKNARNYAQTNGKTQAVSDFNSLNGVFADGSRYIFAYDYNGTTLSLPYQPELIGQNRLNFTDDYGINIIRREISTAKRDGGFVYVQYFNPDTGDAGLKLCYVAPVDDEWFVGSGIYTEKL